MHPWRKTTRFGPDRGNARSILARSGEIASPPTRIDIDLSDERLLIAVSDSGTRGRAARSEPEALSTRGRGLNLVAGLADAWGSEPTVRGSTVWFELLLHRPASGH